jgi:phenylalanyl-tRNA synthetase alpha chain
VSTEPTDILTAVQSLRTEATELLARASDINAIAAWHHEYLSKKGKLSALLKLPGSIKDPNEKKAAFKAVNDLKQQLEPAFAERQEQVKADELARKLAGEQVDVTLPGRPVSLGRVHPSTATIREICSILDHLGFEIYEAPEVETDEYNFQLLNIPPDHPARDMWDTFYTTTPGLILRTHTSPGQIHAMRARAPQPIRIISAGKCFRFEEVSARSETMFHQIEGLAVGHNITFADLKGTLMSFVDGFFGPGRKLRFRKSYFPFTEPSVEVDITCTLCNGAGCSVCKHSGWLEVLGAGMVHPVVLQNGGYDPVKFSGFAFGMGPERLTMLKYRIDDIRYFFSNDVRFLKQF